MPKKRSMKRNGFRDADQAWDQLVNIVQQLASSQTLARPQITKSTARLKLVSLYTRNANLSRAATKHKSFLARVSAISSEYSTLCSVAFSQYQIDSTKESVLLNLEKKVNQNSKNLDIIRASKRCHSEEFWPAQKPKPASTSGCASESTNAGVTELTNAWIPESTNAELTKLTNAWIPELTSAGVLMGASAKWYHFKNHTLEGIRAVLDSDVAAKIKTREDGELRDTTISFSAHLNTDGSLFAFLRLGIHDLEVKILAKAIWNMDVDLTTHGFRVTQENGMVQLNSFGFIQTGVSEECILNLFGSHECSHISVTCDIQAVNIWMHWRELVNAGAATYYMKSIYHCTLRIEKHLLEARELL
ncbi:hypothetical protein EK21DRAFT_95091 [Setomelanomma holmii]|uniref:Uncharacterized protein n=1 Tax=Setomelanomma holmii TaxID=210430 RepID=A0A9P4GY10_9PLEO|nr:hypothetical protein EK21DRAFT_95091 [Setomelanomma holmii]